MTDVLPILSTPRASTGPVSAATRGASADGRKSGFMAVFEAIVTRPAAVVLRAVTPTAPSNAGAVDDPAEQPSPDEKSDLGPENESVDDAEALFDWPMADGSRLILRDADADLPAMAPADIPETHMSPAGATQVSPVAGVVTESMPHETTDAAPASAAGGATTGPVIQAARHDQPDPGPVAHTANAVASGMSGMSRAQPQDLIRPDTDTDPGPALPFVQPRPAADPDRMSRAPDGDNAQPGMIDNRMMRSAPRTDAAQVIQQPPAQAVAGVSVQQSPTAIPAGFPVAVSAVAPQPAHPVTALPQGVSRAGPDAPSVPNPPRSAATAAGRPLALPENADRAMSQYRPSGVAGPMADLARMQAGPAAVSATPVIVRAMPVLPSVDSALRLESAAPPVAAVGAAMLQPPTVTPKPAPIDGGMAATTPPVSQDRPGNQGDAARFYATVAEMSWAPQTSPRSYSVAAPVMGLPQTAVPSAAGADVALQNAGSLPLAPPVGSLSAAAVAPVIKPVGDPQQVRAPIRPDVPRTGRQDVDQAPRVITSPTAAIVPAKAGTASAMAVTSDLPQANSGPDMSAPSAILADASRDMPLGGDALPPRRKMIDGGAAVHRLADTSPDAGSAADALRVIDAGQPAVPEPGSQGPAGADPFDMARPVAMPEPRSEARLNAAAPDLPRQIAQRLAEAPAEAAGQGIELRLSPEELGPLRLTLRAIDGHMTVTVAVERPETLDLMRRHGDQLLQDMRALGYASVRLDMQAQGDRRAPSQPPAVPSETEAPVTAIAPRAPTPGPAPRLVSGGLDLRF